MTCLSISWMTCELFLFSVCNRHFIFLRTSRSKYFSIIAMVNANCWFINKYHFHSIIHAPLFYLVISLIPHFLLFVYYFSLSFGFFVYKSHLIQLISYNSVRNIDSSFEPLFFIYFAVHFFFFYFQDILIWIFYLNGLIFPCCFSWDIIPFFLLESCSL